MEKTLVGAVQRSHEKTTTYFFLGTGEIDIKIFNDIVQKTRNVGELKPEKVLCTAIEREGEPDTEGRFVGFAYLRENGKILIVTIDEFREEYLNLYAKETMVFYDKK